MNLKIKICGMRDPSNVAEVASLHPDYMGFILYRHSPRFIDPEEAEKLKSLIPGPVARVGIIVNEPIENAVLLARKFDFLQLHGNENADYCRSLSGFSRIIKAFRISGSLPVDLAEYLPYCSMFLFDSAGALFGGNGLKFNHRIMEDYNLNKDFFLSGGISPGDLTMISEIKNKYFKGIDLNSRFETKPGVKDTEQLKKFLNIIRKNYE